MPLLVDGYNLLRTIQRDMDPSLTEVQMCQFIGQYLYQKRDTGKVIFDGIGPPDKTFLNEITNPKILFSGTHEADYIIEQLILENTAPKRLVVVSSDRRVKTAAKKRKATAVNSDDYWQSLIKLLENQRPKSPEPPAKRNGISKNETDDWLKEFGLD